MKVKKFTAPSMPEAMKIIREELGSDAVILNSKMVQTDGFLGFFKKRNIEVIAAIDPEPSQPKEVLKEKMIEPPPVKAAEFFPKAGGPSSEELAAEIRELKRLMQQSSSGGSLRAQSSLPLPLKKVQEELAGQEVEPSIIEELMEKLLVKWYKSDLEPDFNKINSWLRELLTAKLETAQYGGIAFDHKIINFVGPTGVGKTTTLAKIAAECVIKQKKKTAFITTDTYRIAAIDQLKTYADILDVPMEVCYTEEDFKAAVDTFKDFEVILIDTAGRNFRNPKYVQELKSLLEAESSQTYLVLSLTSKQRDMEETIKQFSVVDINRFIFTKADETSTFGPLLNIIDKTGKGAAYLTTGQNVPDDLVPASPKTIAGAIMGESKYE
ncbi:flagellar biosynthesis protein FlhF [Bacillus infantis]|uniref:flagellar biosynthesis protein FlhF n=1 Tax=Bacillus infantis TaxID=324767 RepID=UPI00101D70B7|nr:flagellar biosynthesis protein FlhF [Bacillus infantis]RYI32117.1 flagellar biosynthesis protein FlhF [Bacillus infantis]